MYSKVYSKEHPDTVDTGYNMGNVYESQGRFEEAADHFDSAARARTASHGPYHAETLDALKRAQDARSEM